MNKRLYELVIVMRPSLTDADRKKLVDSVKELMKGMSITKDEDLGQKPLAYKIKKEVAGVFHALHAETENTIPEDLERRLIQNDKVIRHLLVRTK